MSLRQAASKAGLPYSTAKKAFRKLRDYGLIKVDYFVKFNKKVDFDKSDWESYRDWFETDIAYTVEGTFYVEKCQLKMFLPKELTERLTREKDFKWQFPAPKKKQQQLISKKYHYNLHRKIKKTCTLNRHIYAEKLFYGLCGTESVEDIMISRALNAAWSGKDKRDPFIAKGIFSLKRKNSASRNNIQRGKKMNDILDGLSDQLDFSEISLDPADHKGVSWDQDRYNKGCSNLPSLDKPRYEVIGPERLNNRTPLSLAVQQMIDAYNAEIKARYAGKGKFWMRKGSFSKQHKLYPKFKAAYDALVEAEMAVSSWATWCFDKLLNIPDSNFKKKPPHLFMVFSPKLIKKWEKWFDNTDENKPIKVSIQEPYRFEQLYRITEARQRLKGLNAWVGLPPEYVKMRLQEIEVGLYDPTACWPTKNKVRNFARRARFK